jgi:hypothetical protein
MTNLKLGSGRLGPKGLESHLRQLVDISEIMALITSRLDLKHPPATQVGFETLLAKPLWLSGRKMFFTLPRSID